MLVWPLHGRMCPKQYVLSFFCTAQSENSDVLKSRVERTHMSGFYTGIIKKKIINYTAHLVGSNLRLCHAGAHL